MVRGKATNMVDAQRALLDELMGTARNMTEDERKKHRELQWDDAAVCKYYITRFCPHDLFYNTKSDLGPCQKKHDLRLKESFEQSPRHKSLVPRYEAELERFCEQLIVELERKVKRSKERLEYDIDKISVQPASAESASKLSEIEQKAGALLKEIEALGEAGQVDAAQKLMLQVDALNIEKASLEALAAGDARTILQQEKKMALCDICGSFVMSGDATERTASHITGKQHNGYRQIREFLEECKDKRAELQDEAGKQRGDAQGGAVKEEPAEGSRKRSRSPASARVDKDTKSERPERKEEGNDRKRDDVGGSRGREHERDRDRDHRSRHDRESHQRRDSDHGRERERNADSRSGRDRGSERSSEKDRRRDSDQDRDRERKDRDRGRRSDRRDHERERDRHRR